MTGGEERLSIETKCIYDINDLKEFIMENPKYIDKFFNL